MKVLIIINEQAGALSAETIEKSLCAELEHYPERIRDNVELFVAPDIQAMHHKIQTTQATLDRVAAAGGDGTVTEVISAILPYPHLQLAIIPVGTGNRLACNLGIPTHIKGALETMIKGVPHRIDIGRINDRYFSLMAGAGLDAEIMDRVHPVEKRTLGIFAYFWQGAKRAFRTPYAVFDIDADGQRIRTRGIGVIVANAGNLLGRYFTLTPGAKPDDGLLDVCVLASRSRMDYWTTIIQILSQQYRGMAHHGVRHVRAQKITIRSRPQMKVQADGDVIGQTPVEIEALPSAVAVLVPKQTQNPIAGSIQHISDHLRLVFKDLLNRSLGSS